MKKTLVALTAATLLGSCAASNVKSIDDEASLNKVKAITEQSFKTVVPKLMGTVMTKVEKEGYASAVSFCNENVAGMGKNATEALSAKFSKEYGIKSFRFGRTTEKLRNPDNAPNAAQHYVLEKWEDAEESGEKASPMFIEADGVYYGMMPIRIQTPVCLGCHGTPDKVDQDAMKVIEERYPDDRATGYKLNDLRGAFYVEIEI